MRISYRQKPKPLNSTAEPVAPQPLISREHIEAEIALWRATLAGLVKGVPDRWARRNEANRAIRRLTKMAAVTPPLGVAPAVKIIQPSAPGRDGEAWRDQDWR